MKLTVSNSNITNNLSTAKLTLANGTISDNLTIGNVSITPSQISVGSATITPTAVSVPTLVLGGTQFSGGLQGGIINYQEFTANGTWNNPLFYTQISVSQGLTYSFYTQGTSTNPTTEAGLDALFNTATSSPTVTFGGTGIHSGTINWGDATSTSGAGGTPGTKPTYLPADQFSWMVEGYILAPETGTYFFGVDGDDAVDVFVNGVNVASYYGAHGFNGAWTGGATGGTQVSGSINLTAGQYYTFRARQQDGGGGDGIQVGWRKPSDGAIALIPASAFYYGTVTYLSNTLLTGYEQVLVMAWGGGGGGHSNGTSGSQIAGGGGACVISTAPLLYFSNTCSVVVGNGGAVNRTSSGVAAFGGNTTFTINATANIVAYGGGPADGSSISSGGGGGTLGPATNFGTGGGPLGGSKGSVSTFGGGGGLGNNSGSFTGGTSIFGGGAGSGASFAGANSIYGGGGGGAGGSVGGTSIFGGNGGSRGLPAGIPGGGGGSNSTSANSGARGEVRVWVFGPAA